MLLVVFSYHWYAGIPTPFVNPIVKGLVIVPPTQTFWDGVGLRLMDGSGCIITCAVFDVICPHPPPPVNVISQ